MTEAGFLEKTTNCNTFECAPQDFAVRVVHRNKKAFKTLVCKRWISLDTETAHNHDEVNPIAWIYQWCFKFGEQIVIGRRPSEFIKALQKIHAALELSKDKLVVVYVHNLSYDISYLRQYLTEAFGKPRILAIKPHKYISFAVDGFIFKCSYKLSNKSLSTWANDLGTMHRKRTEEKAYYDEIHYQDEELSAENWQYQIEDVLTLDECIEKQMEAYGDDILTIPLTSTGYVRRDARRNYKSDRRNRKRFLATRLYVDTYTACREEFAGGLTHGNRFYAGKTVRPEKEKGEFIRHRDFRSHYPTQQRTRKFPVGNMVKYGEHLDIAKIRELTKDYCVLMKVVFGGVKLRPWVVLPTISVSKAYKHRYEPLDMVEDNGRALEIKGTFALYLTDLDLHWILKQYEIVNGYDIEVAYVSAKGYLPDYLKKTVDDYFLGKTKWKMELNAEKEKGEAADKAKVIYLALELMKSKNGLNGIYGMSATDIIREIYDIDDLGEWTRETPDAATALEKYYASENSFNRYQLGIWTTSLARYELLEYADLIMDAGGTVLYVDTDSIFYVSNAEIERKIEDENERRKAAAMEKGAYIEYGGKVVNYDAFEDEGEDITAFRFLHAKCYAYESEGKLHCTIAGVSEWEDSTYQYGRVDELGSIDELKKGKVFERCGGTKAKYVETPAGKVTVNGHEVEAGAACIITPTTKTLNNELTLYDSVIEWEVLS